MRVCIKCESVLYDERWKCTSCGWSPEYQNGIPFFAPELVPGGVSYPTQSHDRLAKLEDNNFWFISRNRLIGYILNNYFPKAVNMLEIGCGNGFVLSGLATYRPDMKFYGAEAYSSGLQNAQKRLPKANFAQMDACNIPFKSEFDVIGAFDVLEHIEDDQCVLKQMYKALKPGGGITITVPQHTWLWSETDEQAGHKRRYTRKDLVDKISLAGFEVEMATSFITLLLPAMAASRFLKIFRKKNQMESNPNAGLCLPGTLNQVFIKTCDLEKFLIKLGFPMPWGGSLACIATKKKSL